MLFCEKKTKTLLNYSFKKHAGIYDLDAIDWSRSFKKKRHEFKKNKGTGLNIDIVEVLVEYQSL